MEARVYAGRGRPVVAHARRLRMATRARRSSTVPSTSESAASGLRRGTSRTGMSRRSRFMAPWNLTRAAADRSAPADPHTIGYDSALGRFEVPPGRPWITSTRLHATRVRPHLMDQRGPLHNVGPQVTLGDRVVTVSEPGVTFTRLHVAMTGPGVTVTACHVTIADACIAVTGPGLAIAEHQGAYPFFCV